MSESRERTSEELLELRRQGIAAHSPVATRLVVIAGVCICLLVELRDMPLDVGSVLTTDSLFVLLRTLIATTAAAALVLGLLSPLVQRKGLVKVSLLTPRYRPFPHRVSIIQLLLGLLVALLSAWYFGRQFAGAIFSVSMLVPSVSLEELGRIFERETLWLAGIATLVALVVAFLAQQRFARGR